MSNKVKVMRADRTVCEIDAAFVREFASNFCLVEASDGLWLPSCDLAQYERGDRPVRHE